MEFQGLKYLKLFPADERYSCEILDSNIILKEDCIIWSDCEDKTELEDGDTGTLVCASKLRWRSIFGYMGEKNYCRCALSTFLLTQGVCNSTVSTSIILDKAFIIYVKYIVFILFRKEIGWKHCLPQYNI